MLHRGIGRAHERTDVIALIKNDHATVTETNGTVLGEYQLDPKRLPIHNEKHVNPRFRGFTCPRCPETSHLCAKGCLVSGHTGHLCHDIPDTKAFLPLMCQDIVDTHNVSCLKRTSSSPRSPSRASPTGKSPPNTESQNPGPTNSTNAGSFTVTKPSHRARVAPSTAPTRCPNHSGSESSTFASS